MKFFSFCLSGKVCVSLLFLRDALAGKTFVVGSFILLPPITICKVSAYKSADRLIEADLDIMNVLSLTASQFSLYLFIYLTVRL